MHINLLNVIIRKSKRKNDLTEQLGEHDKPLHNFGVAELEGEIRLSTLTATCLMNGYRQSQESCTDRLGAMAKATAFDHDYNRLFAKEVGLQDKPLIVSGEGVLVVNFHIQGNDTGEVLFKIDPDNPLRPLDSLDSRTVTYSHIKTFYEQSVEDEQWRVKPYIVCQETNTKQRQMTMRAFDVPLWKFSEPSSVFIECNPEKVNVDVVKLHNYQKRVKAVENLSNNTPRLQEVVEELVILGGEFTRESPRGTHTTLQDIESLRAIGQKGVNHMLNGAQDIETLNLAIAAVIGENRTIAVSGDVYSSGNNKKVMKRGKSTAIGHLMAVVSEIPTVDYLAGPTFVISGGSKMSDIFYIPFTSATSVKF